MSTPKYWAVAYPNDDLVQIKDPAAGMRVIHRLTIINPNLTVNLALHGYFVVGKFCARGDGAYTALVKRSK